MHQYRQLGSRTTAGEGGRTVNRIGTGCRLRTDLLYGTSHCLPVASCKLYFPK